MDVEVQISGEETKTATIVKANDGPGGHLTAYRMSPVQLGTDEDGEPVQTFIVDKEILQKASEAPREPKLSKKGHCPGSIVRFGVTAQVA